VPLDPISYRVGADVQLTDLLKETVQGYVNLDQLNNAIPASVTFLALPDPECGVLTRKGTSQ